MLEENGNLLRVTRELKGLSFAEVEEETKIREFYLQHLEEGNMEGLPGRIYAIGFADTYARFLGLDPAPLVDDIKAYYADISANTGFEAYVSGKKVVQTAAEGSEPDPAWYDVKDKAESRLGDRNSKAERANQLRASAYANGSVGQPIRTRNRRFGRRFLWILLGSAIIVLLLVLYLLQDNAALPGFMQGSEPPPVASGVVTEDAPIGLIVTATDEDAWVGVNVDGETNTQVVIPAGSSQAFTAQKMLYVRYNKATHVTLEYNGETISNFSMGEDKWNMKFYPDHYEGYPDSARTDLTTNADTNAGTTPANAGTTTNAGTTPTNAGTTTTNAGGTAANAGSTTTNAGTTANAGTTTSAGSTSTSAGKTTTSAGSTTTNTGKTTTNAGSTTTNSGSTTTNAGSTTTNSGSATTNSGSTTTNSGSTTTNAGGTTTNTGSTTGNTGSTTGNAGSTTTNAGSTTTNAGSTTTNAGSTTTDAGVTAGSVGGDTTAPATSGAAAQ